MGDIDAGGGLARIEQRVQASGIDGEFESRSWRALLWGVPARVRRPGIVSEGQNAAVVGEVISICQSSQRVPERASIGGEMPTRSCQMARSVVGALGRGAPMIGAVQNARSMFVGVALMRRLVVVSPKRTVLPGASGSPCQIRRLTPANGFGFSGSEL
ncbi:MAG: hypothetical protein K2X32_03985 [Phycisphaerales bacterium]|nr:hypothetical protein [Phycisphaerales bacterium]